MHRLPTIPLRQPPSLRDRLRILGHGQVSATVGISFLTALGSLGLYTYLAPILHALTGAGDIKYDLWVWGTGGLIGSFAVGPLIDRTAHPARLLTGILVILTASLASLPLVALAGPVALVPFLLWGAMGWASLAPQQHMLLDLQPDHGPAAVALNSSCNYLGSAAGALMGGVLMSSGVNPAALPYYAAAATLAAALGHLARHRVQSTRPAPA